jgi:hypothetical protein
MVIASAMAALMFIVIGQAVREIRDEHRSTALAVTSIVVACTILLGVAWWFLFATGVFAFSN